MKKKIILTVDTEYEDKDIMMEMFKILEIFYIKIEDIEIEENKE